MEAISAAEPFRFTPRRVDVGAAPAAAEMDRRDDSRSSGVGPQASAEGIVDQTRREIASIVRETALLARRDQSPAAFFAGLVDRVARAMAAEGVVVWRADAIDGQTTFIPVARVGRITDRSLGGQQIACHQRMLRAVVEGGQPVVVPATPDACDAALPANPADVPVAIVPVMEIDRTDYLLEVFLEPEGGLATQRGYLRFTAQMADLAGEFLRLHQIRQARRSRQRWQRLAGVLPGFHRSLDIASTWAAVVDGAAAAIESDRVSLCRVRGGRATVVAVSHVQRVDRGSPAAMHVARLALQGDGRQPFFPPPPDPLSAAGAVIAAADGAADADRSLPSADSGTASPPPPAEALRAAAPPDAAPPDDAPLCCEAVLPLDADGSFRLVFQSVQPSVQGAPQDADDARRGDMLLVASHAAAALRNARDFSGVPWARLAVALAPASSGLQRSSRGTAIVVAGVLVLLVIVGFIPVPLVVRATGEMLPAETSYVYAPRDGTVTEVLVEHGAVVRQGDLLMRIVDRSLEQAYETLLGRRAVLDQRAAELGTALVDPSQRAHDESQRLQAERRIIDEERAAVDRQLSLLQIERRRLELRSDRDGVVDGWQLRRQWTGRPVSRGQMLLSVIDTQGDWQVEALIPQSRLDHVIGGLPADGAVSGDDRRQAPSASVVLQAYPDTPLTAVLEKVGPALVAPAADGPAGRALFHITSGDLPTMQTGAPAEVAIDCGRRPLAYVAFQDLIRTLRGRWGMYF